MTPWFQSNFKRIYSVNVGSIRLVTIFIAISMVTAGSWESTCYAASDVVSENVVDEAADRPYIGVQWTAALEKQIGNDTGIVRTVLNTLATDSPFSSATNLRLFLTTSKARERGEAIAGRCVQLFPNQPWQQIHCLAMSIHKTIRKYGVEGFTTPCQSFAYAFKSGFEMLRIPRSHVGYKASYANDEGHLFNRFHLIDEKGRVYSYVIDVMMMPQTIFPLTYFTEAFHAIGNRQKLPEI